MQPYTTPEFIIACWLAAHELEPDGRPGGYTLHNGMLQACRLQWAQ